MNVLKSLLDALKKSVRNFPGTLTGSFAAAAFTVIVSAGDEIWNKRIDEAREIFGAEAYQVEALREASEVFCRRFGRWCAGSVFAAVFAFLAGLLCICLARSCGGKNGLTPFQKEVRRDNWLRASFVLQALSLPVCVLVFFLFRDFGSSVQWMRYLGAVFAMLAVAIFLLHFIQEETQVAPNIIVAFVIAGIASTCLLSGLMLVVVAFQQLIYKFESFTPFLAVICFTYMVFGVNVLVAYTAREEKDISIPKPFTVIMSYVLFPLTLVLLAVLYLYLFKCLFTRTMPVGQMNPFVSIATALFFIFYVSLEDRVRLFKKWGNFLFLPLIPLQILAFAIRVSAYGFTEIRVASLYYIIVSVIFCLLPLFRRGRCMKLTYPLLALFLLAATWGPLNIFSVTLRNQSGRVVRVFKSHGLYDGENHRIIPDTRGSLSLEDKAAIVSAYDKLADMDLAGRAPSWWIEKDRNQDRSGHFQKLFGFEWSRNYAKDEDVNVNYSFYYNMEKEPSEFLDISGYTELFWFEISDWMNYEGRNLAGTKMEEYHEPEISLPDGTVISIQEELESRLKEQGKGKDREDNELSGSTPLLLCSKQGYDVYVTSCCMNKELTGEGKLNYLSYNAEGFVFKATPESLLTVAESVN